MHLLSRIERYLRKTATPPTRFGRQVLGDPCFVRDLRNGREPRSQTAERVAAFLKQAEAAPDETTCAR